MKKSLISQTKEDDKYLSKILFTEAEVRNRAKELAIKIKESFPRIDCLVCPLKGAKFWSDLLEAELHPEKRIDTDISLWDKGEEKISTDLVLENINFKDKNVIIAEDLVATGATLNYVTKQIQRTFPANLAVCTMVDKADVRLEKYSGVNKYIKYVGFSSNQNEYLIGYGLGSRDLPQHLRNLKNIYLVKHELYKDIFIPRKK